MAEPAFSLSNILQKIANSDYLQGKKNGFKATFDWVFDSKNNYLKIIEGNYDNEAFKPSFKPPTPKPSAEDFLPKEKKESVDEIMDENYDRGKQYIRKH